MNNICIYRCDMPWVLTMYRDGIGEPFGSIDVFEWLEQNCQGEYVEVEYGLRHHLRFRFELENDATMFKLRFGV